MTKAPHFTTRRGFIAAGGFGGLSLYGLWAAYGAAPTPLAFLGLDNTHAPSPGAGAAGPASQAGAGAHSAHGGASSGPSAQEFSRMTTEFVQRYQLPDGTVYPRRLEQPQAASDPHAGHDMAAVSDDPHAGHSQPTAPPEAHAGHTETAPPDDASSDAHGTHDNHTAPGAATSAHPEATPTRTAIDVLMVAGKWYYLPNVLRLDAGQPYRFRMMALDVAHGASIQFGKGGRMMRLQPGRVSETEMTFTRPGRYLMLCTVYCGDAHDRMQASIEVV